MPTAQREEQVVSAVVSGWRECKSPRARGAQREGEQEMIFSTITEIAGRDSDFDQKLILAARGQLNGGDGMRGRRDLGGPWPKCRNAPHSKTYMAAQRVVWTLQ